MKHPLVNHYDHSDTGELILNLTIAKNTVFFDGHFPGNPILPGVVQVDWVLHFAAKHLNIKKATFLHIEQLKFTRVITPGLCLNLWIKIEDQRLSFKYFADDATYSLGRLKAKP